MARPHAGCDAPGCSEDLVALIRGVGLCDEHLRRIAEVAAQQDVDPAELSRAVILTLLTPAGSATPAERFARPHLVPRAKKTRPGFYWVRDEGDWTVIQVSANGEFRRLGHEGAWPVAD